MIAVIADDITGAAEMGGIALRYGLQVIISDDVKLAAQADVFIVYTNTRSMPKEEAVKVMEGVTGKMTQLSPTLFYKKTDSVLRGHVLSELQAQMRVLNMVKALLVPVNPSMGRTIRNGQYFINDQLIHETSFSLDPEFPVLDSRIERMLGSQEVKVLSEPNPVSAEGVFVGEAETNEDVHEWASHVDETIFPAGGASFFNALLSKRLQNKTANIELQLYSPTLLVSGTTYNRSVERIKKHSQLVSYMPSDIFLNEGNDFESWRDEIVLILSRYNKAIVAVKSTEGVKANPNSIKDRIGQVIKLVFEKIAVAELWIEGGSTAYSIVNKLGWGSFIPTEELEQGIVRMKVKGREKHYLTIKPGSYDWPSQWDFN
jgi:uncharacterized protein YgbK (DUF1537 family)